MARILKINAFQAVVEAMEKDDFKTANAILDIINRAIIKEKKNNFFSEDIELSGKKEKKYFPPKYIQND